jgi:hypothetical protein
MHLMHALAAAAAAAARPEAPVPVPCQPLSVAVCHCCVRAAAQEAAADECEEELGRRAKGAARAARAAAATEVAAVHGKLRCAPHHRSIVS